ncbi:phage tail tube protein [Bacillus sp. JJ1474]|uniref:phage tail tube protein n=1 Tax=Bacillus sp. JJ1474 TaxID=3122955 RepID=UPI002FFF7140
MATRGLGTVLKMATKKVAGLTQIGGLDLSADTIDVTTLDSEGGYKEFIGGFKDAGEVSLSGFFDLSTDSGQKDLYDAFESGNTSDFSIEFPQGINAKWTFKGVVTGFKTDTGTDDPVSFEATIKVSGKPTLDMISAG